MRRRTSPILLALSLVLSLVSTSANAAVSKDKDGTSSRDKIADKLPAKGVSKRTYVDFSKDDTAVVLSPRAADLDRVLRTSDRDVKSANAATTTVRSRKIMAAPEGDSAEPMSALVTSTPAATPAPMPVQTTTKTTKTLSKTANVVAAKNSTTPIATAATPTPAPAVSKLESVPVAKPAAATPPVQTTSAVQATPSVEKIEPVFVGPVAPPIPVRPPVPFQPFDEFPETAKVPRAVARPLPPSAPVPDVEVVVEKNVATKETSAESKTRSESRLPRKELGDGFFKAVDAKSMVFIRGGFFNAKYKKFDDRMSNGATSMGIAAARGLETSWGEFEVRAAFDVYHAMDQSVTIDNVRMFNARTEVAYWLSHSRVKPGLSLGLGMADYSIRSYRSISDSNEDTVVLKTHAKSRAFSVIPATSLRVEVAPELVVDAQTEFMALLGGDNADAAQGLGVTLSLGWLF